ncbi:GNAT family N-acetyltransferase [Roseateles sp. DC23W]|uniref:GNAT family N-acetyltransferase n=1 Tax=Pelomonas dachongensis TaxID=3299029 RepID=A0ABW7EMF2_9BURK
MLTDRPLTHQTLPILSALDAERFGWVTAKLTVDTTTDFNAVDAWLEAHAVRFVIARVATDDTAQAQALEARGYRLMDTLLYYLRTLGGANIAPLELQAGYDLDVARPSPAEMRALAAQAFRGYMGHYHADPAIAPALADEVYASWAERSATDPAVAQHIVAIRYGSRLAAFATLNTCSGACEGVLFAVDTSHRNQGLHRALVRASLAHAQAGGCHTFFSSTQVANHTVQRNWIREGLLPDRGCYTFHLTRE